MLRNSGDSRSFRGPFSLPCDVSIISRHHHNTQYRIVKCWAFYSSRTDRDTTKPAPRLCLRKSHAKSQSKGKAAAEAAAFPVIRRSPKWNRRYYTICKRKPPRIMRRSRPYSKPKRNDAGLTIQFYATTKKPPGRLIPRRHMQFPTQPPMRLVDTSKCWLRLLQTPKQAQPPQEEVPVLYPLALRLVNASRPAIPRRVARSCARSRRPPPLGCLQRWSTPIRWPQAPPKTRQAPNQRRQARRSNRLPQLRPVLPS